MLDKNKIGLSLGIFFATVHAVFSLAVAVMPAMVQSYLNWMFKLHSFQPVLTLAPFNLMNAVLLVVMTFIVGYILGFVFAWAHNVAHKKK